MSYVSWSETRPSQQQVYVASRQLMLQHSDWGDNVSRSSMGCARRQRPSISSVRMPIGSAASSPAC